MNIIRLTKYSLESIPPAFLERIDLREGVAPGSLQTYAPVLALTLTRRTPNGRDVLSCVRDPRNNRTHPNVLSSPTRRLRGLADLEDLFAPDGKSWNRGIPPWLGENIQALAQDKLGIHPNQLFGAPSAVAAWQGRSIIGTRFGRLVSESLTMINVHVDTTGMEAVIPSHTAAYSDIRWIPAETHAELVRTRRADVHDLSYSPTPIVYGLCTSSTGRMLESTANVPAG